MSIIGNMVGGSAPLKTVILTDESGNEIATGVVVEQETVFTATDNDVREGMVYAGDSGVSTGSKIIPSYHTSYGYKLVPSGSEVRISIPEYDYTYLMVSVAIYNTSRDQSVITTYTSIDNGMYNVGNNIKIADISVDYDNEQIVLGITVDEKSIVRYLVTREEF